jgi:YbgC/YbaW family acyl-CoA thioester hydrolase
MISHVEKLRVRWVDTDASGIIHYTAAFRYFEAAEWELFRKAGIPFRSHEKEFGLPRVSVNATFHAPLRVDEEIAVHICPERLGNTSITFALEVFRDETLCISGTVSVVFTGQQGKPIPIPAAIRQALTASV